MADTKTENKRSGAQEGQRGLARRENRGLRRLDPEFSSPFEFMERMSEEMDRWFEDVTRSFGFPRWSPLSRTRFGRRAQEGVWTPRIEAGLEGDSFVVRADLPGLKKDDIQVEVTDDAITISGERREEHEEEHEGYWRSEREYGKFYRSIPLPEGAIGETAQASFRDGVLEIRMQAPPAEATRGRRIEITEGSPGQNK
jgi:HSP20 family protein